ncbi:AIPR family protein [Muricauda brasiliensis]|uniref:AIPR family protein n=1 Tax=Muricauda brasiliensis TaxID=2162892 RepID=UPI000D376A03|nr:AIPR family protein [Muricauda brasiliensis]
MNNTVMITECLAAFKVDNEITLSDSDAFELYTLYLLNKKSNLGAEDLLNAVVDGSSDGGIDTFLIAVDEFVVNSEEDLESINISSDSTLKVTIGQSKFNNRFSEEVVNKFFISMDSVWNLELTEEQLSETFNEQLVERITWVRTLWKKAIVKGARINIHFYYGCISNEINESDGFRSKKEKVVEQATEKVHQASVSFDLYSAEELLALHSQKTEVHLELKFKEQPSTIDYGGNNIGFIGVVKLPDYYDFITDEEGVIRESIFEENVRHYQGEVDVNKKINESLSNEYETDFWWLNNGITIIAQDVRPMAKTLQVDGVQIVNGLQTSYTIGKNYEKNDSDTRSVLVKIVKSTDKETIDKIISATNRQTPVNPALLRATDDIQRKLELYFEQKGYYYDRRKNFYKNQGKPISKIFAIQSTAQSIHAILNRKPSESRAKPTTLIKTTDSYETIFRPNQNFQSYLNCCLVVRSVETKIKNSEFTKSEKSLVRTFTYHTARIAVSEMTGKSHPNQKELSELDLSNFTDELFNTSVDILKETISEFGTNSATTSHSSISKSGPFEELINQKMITRFSGN